MSALCNQYCKLCKVVAKVQALYVLRNTACALTASLFCGTEAACENGKASEWKGQSSDLSYPIYFNIFYIIFHLNWGVQKL